MLSQYATLQRHRSSFLVLRARMLCRRPSCGHAIITRALPERHGGDDGNHARANDASECAHWRNIIENCEVLNGRDISPSRAGRCRRGGNRSATLPLRRRHTAR
jgi:hypothetical protein